MRGPKWFHGPEFSLQEAETILGTALDLGINYIDTSSDYGTSEELIGKYISHRRSEYYLATKCGCLVGGDPPPPGRRYPHIFSRENIVAAVDQSLARMNTDYIDVIQFHNAPPKNLLEATGAVETLLELKRAGKVRFTGISGTRQDWAAHVAMGVFDVFQLPYSALQRQHEDTISQAARAGAGIVVRGGTAKGAPAEGKQEGPFWDEWQRAQLDDLVSGMTRLEFMVRFTFSHPDLDTCIIGTKNPNHLREDLEAFQKGPLPKDMLEEAKRRLASAGIVPRTG